MRRNCRLEEIRIFAKTELVKTISWVYKPHHMLSKGFLREHRLSSAKPNMSARSGYHPGEIGSIPNCLPFPGNEENLARSHCHPHTLPAIAAVCRSSHALAKPLSSSSSAKSQSPEASRALLLLLLLQFQSAFPAAQSRVIRRNFLNSLKGEDWKVRSRLLVCVCLRGEE